MRVAFVNSGLGVLASAAEIRRLRPDADVVLSIDPAGMPWGPRPVREIVERTMMCAQAAMQLHPDVMVLACNTASVHALDELRARIEPWVPVVGTVPAIKPAAARGGQVAVWATVATSGSAYQRRLIREFGRGARVEPIACPGLADAIDAGDDVGIEQAVWAAAAKTPAGTTDVVLGCTEYELIPDRIAAALDGHVTLHASAPAIAAQVMRRSRQVSAQGHRRLHVLLSGLSGCLPEVARRYRPGQVLLASSPSEIGA